MYIGSSGHRNGKLFLKYGYDYDFIIYVLFYICIVHIYI